MCCFISASNALTGEGLDEGVAWLSGKSMCTARSGILVSHCMLIFRSNLFVREVTC